VLGGVLGGRKVERRVEEVLATNKIGHQGVKREGAAVEREGFQESTPVRDRGPRMHLGADGTEPDPVWSVEAVADSENPALVSIDDFGGHAGERGDLGGPLPGEEPRLDQQPGLGAILMQPVGAPEVGVTGCGRGGAGSGAARQVAEEAEQSARLRVVAPARKVALVGEQPVGALPAPGELPQRVVPPQIGVGRSHRSPAEGTGFLAVSYPTPSHPSQTAGSAGSAGLKTGLRTRETARLETGAAGAAGGLAW